MKTLKIISLMIISLSLNLNIQGQEKVVVVARTAEQEAAKQTERIQKELNLSKEQAKQVHEINLKYARERQISNSRSEALQRIKNKDEDYKRVLNQNQYKQLKRKKIDNTGYNSSNLKRTSPTKGWELKTTSRFTKYRTIEQLRKDFNRTKAATKRK